MSIVMPVWVKRLPTNIGIYANTRVSQRAVVQTRHTSVTGQDCPHPLPMHRLGRASAGPVEHSPACTSFTRECFEFGERELLGCSAGRPSGHAEQGSMFALSSPLSSCSCRVSFIAPSAVR